MLALATVSAGPDKLCVTSSVSAHTMIAGFGRERIPRILYKRTLANLRGFAHISHNIK